jgi:methyl-accepting chemotaxis protein
MDGVRRLILGRQFTEMQTKVAELQMSLNGEMKRIRDTVLQRVDEMASLMHRDMVVLRQEVLGEVEQLKKDIFTAATDLSMTKDRLMQVEKRAAEHFSASAQDLDARLNQQSSAMTDAICGLEDRMKTVFSSEIKKVAKLADRALARQEMAGLLKDSASKVESIRGHEIETGWPSPPADSPASRCATA